MATPDRDIAPWIDERLATLDPPEGWVPDETSGLVRLRGRRVEGSGHRRRWLWLAIAAGVLVLMVIPQARLRGFAQACGEFVLGGLSGSHATHARTGSAERVPLPDVALRDLGGRTVSLSEYRGKVVLLTYWTTTCGQCESEMPWFNEFQQRYGDRGFQAVGVAVDSSDTGHLGRYVAARPISYRVVLGDRDEIAQRHAARSIPTTFILDRSGRVAVRHVGYCSKREFDADIRAVLAEP